MTAWSITRHEIYCNGRIPAADDPDKTRACFKAYKPPEDAEGRLTPAALRKLAAEDGWTHVRSPLGRGYDRDFCAEHKPAPAGEG